MARSGSRNRGPGVRNQKGRRPNGEGSCYQRGDIWYAAVTIAPGRRVVRRADSQRDAERIRLELLILRDEEKLFSTDRQTLGQYLAHWLRDTAQHRLRPHSYWCYTSRLAHVQEHLGTVQLRLLKPSQIDTLYATLLREGLSPVSVKDIHTVLKAALRHAVRRRIIPENPLDVVDPPKAELRSMRVLSVEHQAALLDSFVGTRWYALFRVLLQGGLRINEALALTWDDWDERRLILRVEKTVTMIRGGEKVIGPVKTQAGVRDVPFGPRMRETLREHRQLQRQTRLETLGWHDSDLIFPNRHGDLMHTEPVRERLQVALRRLGLPTMRVHDLRHTAATTMLHHMGLPVRVVQERLGHANVRITLGIYGHTDAAMHRDAGAKIDGLF